MAIADATTERTITAENVGPIVRAEIPYPENGGIVVFRGPNNVGKSILVNGMEALTTGRAKIEARDGSQYARMEGLGLVLKAGASNRRTGQLEVHGLDGKLDMGDLVDPGIKDPAAADAKRIKALMAIAKPLAERSKFAEVLQGHEEFVEEETFKTDDIVEMARRVKAAMDKAALRCEDQSKKKAAAALALSEGSKAIDVTAPHDAKLLQAEFEAAVEAQGKIRQQFAAADKLLADAQRGRDALEDAEAEWEGLTIEQATVRVQEAVDSELAAKDAVAAAEDLLRKAKTEHESAKTRVVMCSKDLQSAEAHNRDMAGWRKAVADAENVVSPNAKEISDAGLRVEQAREAIERGAIIRAALENRARSVAEQKEASQLAIKADRLRDAAKEAEGVLSAEVATLGCPLRVESGRLVLDVGDQKSVPFSRQSMGARYAIVVPLAVRAIKRGDIITLSQEAWEGLDWDNRNNLNELICKAGVVLYTAECDAHQVPKALRAELYGEVIDGKFIEQVA